MTYFFGRDAKKVGRVAMNMACAPALASITAGRSDDERIGTILDISSSSPKISSIRRKTSLPSALVSVDRYACAHTRMYTSSTVIGGSDLGSDGPRISTAPRTIPYRKVTERHPGENVHLSIFGAPNQGVNPTQCGEGV